MIFQKFPQIIFATSKIADGNMSLLYGNPTEALINRQKFFNKLNINPNLVMELRQIHRNKIIKVTKRTFSQKLPSADGLITNQSNIFLLIKAADCHQIAIFDPKRQAIALIHAGWRGLDKEIIKNAIRKMNIAFTCKPADLIVQFGPAIGPCCYFKNIWQQAENQLLSFGILKTNIDNPRICTYHTNIYFSHRKAMDSNTQDFRFITILGIRNVN